MSKNKFKELLASINNDPQHRDSNILVVDGLNTFLRNFTAINRMNVHGHHTGGLTGTLQSIGYGIKQTQPTRVIIVFDGVGGSNAKRNLYPPYKMNRDVTKITNSKIFKVKSEEIESIENQMGRLLSYISCLPVTTICIDGIEADDVIGHLADRYEADPNCKKFTIMSADRDFLQLLSEKIFVYSPTKKIVYDIKKFIDEFQVYPHNYLLYKTLMGDKGDNVPKVKGFGEDKLFKMFPYLQGEDEYTLDELLGYIDPEDPWGYKLLNFEPQLRINYQIMGLKNMTMSHGNIRLIDERMDNAKRDCDSYNFLKMYYQDALGEGIRNVENWLTEVFGYLSNFKTD